MSECNFALCTVLGTFNLGQFLQNLTWCRWKRMQGISEPSIASA